MIKSLILILLIFPTSSYYQQLENYLILQNIGAYKLAVPEVVFEGEPPIGGPRTYDSSGVIAGADHFSNDHADKTYEVMYIGGNGVPSPTVQVTQHASGVSDQWLLHEVETGFRFGDHEEDMRPSRFRTIDGNNVFYTKLGGGTYWWLNNNIVVAINYTDLYHQKTEPLEVVRAYLVKFPSTIPAMTIDQAHNETWIKIEMERRLWLCDKWVEQKQAGTVDGAKLVNELYDHMDVFLNYRKKYYGVGTLDEKKAIYDYERAKDETAMKNKLNDYKAWWTANKSKTIKLP